MKTSEALERYTAARQVVLDTSAMRNVSQAQVTLAVKALEEAQEVRNAADQAHEKAKRALWAVIDQLPALLHADAAGVCGKREPEIIAEGKLFGGASSIATHFPAATVDAGDGVPSVDASAEAVVEDSAL